MCLFCNKLILINQNKSINIVILIILEYNRSILRDIIKKGTYITMILAIDMGNTAAVLGCIDDQKIYFTEELSTDLSKSPLEYAMGIKTVLELYNIDSDNISGAIISCVVPSLQQVISRAVKKIINKAPLIVGPGLKTGLNIKMDNAREMGSDLIVDSVAGINRYGAPLIIIDMGTATTISVIDKDRNYIGGAITPGVNIAMNALSSNAAQLFNVGLQAPSRVIGKNTVECMQSGIILGNASCIDGMIDRIEDELGYRTTVVATGGLSGIVIPYCRHDIIIEPRLLLMGLKLLYDKNA